MLLPRVKYGVPEKQQNLGAGVSRNPDHRDASNDDV